LKGPSRAPGKAGSRSYPKPHASRASDNAPRRRSGRAMNSRVRGLVLMCVTFTACDNEPIFGSLDSGTDASMDAGRASDAGRDAGDNDGGIIPEVAVSWTSEAFAGCTYASPIWITSRGEEQILAVDQLGLVAGLDPETGERAWTVQLPRQGGDVRIELFSTPTVVQRDGADRYVFFAWQDIDPTWLRHGHRVAAIDLETRALATDFPMLTLEGSSPAFDGSGDVVFESRWQLQRGTLLHVDVSDRELGLIYVPLGNGPSEQPFHGWVFELDLDAWQDDVGTAIVGTLLTTQESDCGPLGNRDASRCGGGVWNASGLLIDRPDPDGPYDLYVPTGNGRQDLDRGAYAHSVMRTGRGLAFERNCDETLCATYDQFNPDPACQASCENVFLARLPVGDPPLVPEDGSCDGLTFMECYGVLDADLGANAPVIFDVPDGPRVLVQPGKDGALYLFDAEHMGTLYQRVQAREVCGTATMMCQAFWAGMFVTRPAVAYVDGDPIVIAASLMLDSAHYSGISAYRVVMEDGAPRMIPHWDAPPRDSAPGLTAFRNHPGRPVVANIGGEDYVFVVEVRRDTLSGSPPGYLWGVRARDGEVIAHLPITGAGQRFAVPLVHDDTLYITTCDARATGEGRIEAFSLSDRRM
jgi:hypothetical protein